MKNLLSNKRIGSNQFSTTYKYPFGLNKGAFWSAVIVGLIAIIIALSFYIKHTTDQQRKQQYIDWVKRTGSPLPHLERGMSIGVVYAYDNPSPTPTPVNYEAFSTREKVIHALSEHFGFEHIDEIEHLVQGESSFNQYAVNPNGGACGIFQAWPCVKMGCELSDLDCQISWGISYIEDRYGSPTQAYKFWLNQDPHWY